MRYGLSVMILLWCYLVCSLLNIIDFISIVSYCLLSPNFVPVWLCFCCCRSDDDEIPPGIKQSGNAKVDFNDKTYLCKVSLCRHVFMCFSVGYVIEICVYLFEATVFYSKLHWYSHTLIHAHTHTHTHTHKKVWFQSVIILVNVVIDLDIVCW